MCMNINTTYLNLPDVSKIIDYMNIALIGATILIFVILILCFLRGLLRGWKKGTYHFIFMIILFAVAIFTLDAVTNLAMTTDISGIRSSVDIPLGGDKVATIKITTIGDTLKNGIVTILRDNFKITDDTTALYNYASALSISIVKFALVFVETLLILILGNLLALILWHILFKFILPYHIRKRHNLRWISGIQSLVVGVVTMSLLISPLTSLVNTVNNHLDYNGTNKNENTAQIVELAEGVLNTYNDSLFAKVFFSWAKPDGTNTLDYMLMDALTKSKTGDTTVSMLNEVAAFSSIAGDAAKLYFGNSFTDGIAWRSMLTSTEQVTGIIKALGQTELFKVAAPFAVKVAAGLDQVVEKIGQETADYIVHADVDWQTELQIVSDLYVSAVESGGFDFISDEHSNKPVPLFDDPYAIVFNDTFRAKLAEITVDVDKMALLDRVLTGFLYTFINSDPKQAKDDDPATLQLIDLMPLKADNTIDYEKMVSYQWGEELITLIDPLYDIHDDNPGAVKAICDLMVNRFKPKEGEEPVDPQTFNDELIDLILAIAADSTDTVIEAIVGPRDANGNPITDAQGKVEDKYCMMDSIALNNALHAIPDYLGASASKINESIGEIDMSKSKAILFADESEAGIRKAFKKEFGSVLDVLGEVASYEEGRELIKHYKDHPGVDIDLDSQFLGINANLARALQAGLRHLDDSCLMRDIVPPVGKYYIESNDAVKQLGIEKIYLEGVDFGNELADLMELFIRCPDVVRFAGTINGNGEANRAYAMLEQDDFCDQLITTLDLIGHCDIINPPEAHNKPIYAMVTHIVPKDAPLEFTEEDFDIKDLFCEYDEKGTRTFKGETYFMVNALSEIVKSGAADTLGNDSGDTKKMIHELTKIDLESLFQNIGSSSLLRKSITKTLDKEVVENMLKPSEVNVDNITFDNLNFGTRQEITEKWRKEGKALSAIAALADCGVNFDSLDVFGGDGANLLGVLKKFSASGIFTYIDANNQSHYLFNEYIYNKLLVNLKGDELAYFVDQNMRAQAKTMTSDTPLADKQAISTTFHANCQALDKPEDWANDGAQLDIFIDIVKTIGDLGGMDALSKITPDNVPQMRTALDRLVDSDVCGNVVIPNAIEDAIDSIDADDFDFSNANTLYLWSLNDYADKEAAKTDRRIEVTYVMNVMAGLFDTHYGLYKEDPVTGKYKLDMSQMNVYTISTEYFMRPVLQNSRNSIVLSTRKDPGKLSMFQLTMATFIKHSGIYGEIGDITSPISDYESNKYVDFSISELVEGISPSEWDDEIDRLCLLMDRAKETIFIDPVQKNINFEAISDPKTFFNSDVTGKNEQDLRDLVTMLNGSMLFYRSLPFHLSRAFSDINVMGDGEFMVDVGYANSYFNVIKDAQGRHDQVPYAQSDIDSMLDVLKTFGSKASGIDMKDITNIDADGVTELLSKMGRCSIFNYYNEETSPTKDLTNHKKGLTSFQCVIADFLCTDALQEYYFKSDSPKDAYHVNEGDYNNLQTKAVYEVKRLMPNINNGFGDDQIEILYGEQNSLRSALTSLTDPALSNIVSSEGFEVGDLNYETFMLLLGNLNRCVLTQDMVPNAISSMVGSNEGAYNIDIDGVNFDRGNYYFSYWWYDDGTGFRKHPNDSPDFDQKFYEPELEQIASICAFLMTNKDQIESLDDHSGGAGSNTFNITKIDPYLLRDLLAELDSSYVFHLAGPDTITRSSYEPNPAFVVQPIGGTAFELSPVSVFHQLMYKFYVDSGLASQAFNSVYDINYYLTYGKEYGPKVKVYNNIITFDDGMGDFSHAGNWLEEIEALTTDGRKHHGYSLDDTEVGLIETIKSLNSILGGKTVDLDVDQFRKLSPAQIRWVLEALNRVDIIADALPNSTRDLITTNNDGDGLGIHKYTSYTNHYDLSSNPVNSWTRPANVYELSPLDDPLATRSQRVASRSIRFKYTGDPSAHFGVSIVFNNVELDCTSVTNAATAVPDAEDYVTIDLRGVPGDFTITCLDPAGRISSLDYEYDTANFRQTQQSFAEKDIDSIYYFLASAYRGKNVTGGDLYFHFDNDNGILEFLNEAPSTLTPSPTVYKHSTYGLMNFFLTSNIYSQTFDKDGLLTETESDIVFTAGDYALYNLFQLEVDYQETDPSGNPKYDPSGNPVTKKVNVNIADNFGSGDRNQHLEYLNFQRNHYYSVPMTVEHSLLESAYLDNYIVNSGTLQAYIDTSKVALDKTQTAQPDVGFVVTSYALGFAQNEAVQNYLDKVMTVEYTNTVNGHYDDSIGGCPDEFKISLDDPAVRQYVTGSTDPITEPGYIGKSILAGQTLSMMKLNYASINIENADRTIASPLHSGVERNTMIRSTDVIDPYGYDSVNQKYTFATLKSNVTLAGVMTKTLNHAFAGMENYSFSRLNDAQKEVLATDVEAFDAYTGEARNVIDAFYAGALYNLLVSRLSFYNVSAFMQNDVIDMNAATNVIQTSDALNPVITDVAFSYANVATAIRQAA